MLRFTLALTLLTAAPEVAGQTLTTAADLEKIPPQILANALLPAHSPPIASVEFDVSDVSPPVIYFSTRALRASGDFCSQEKFDVPVTRIPTDPAAAFTEMPRRAGDVSRNTAYRYQPAGQACDGGRSTFYIYNARPARIFRYLRVFDGIVARARQGSLRSLPFEATCINHILARPKCEASELLQPLHLVDIEAAAVRPKRQLRFFGALGEAAAHGRGKLVDLRLANGVIITDIQMLFRADRVVAMEITRSLRPAF